MRTSLVTVAVAAMVVSAQSPIQFGVIGSPALVVPSVDASGSSTSLGFGGKVAATMEWTLSEKFALSTNAGYMLATWGTEESFAGMGKMTSDGIAHFVSLDAGASFAIQPKLKAFGGLGVDIPVKGEVTMETKASPGYEIMMYSDEGGATKKTVDITDDNTEVLLVAGVGYKLTDKIGLDARYRFALTEYATDFKLSELLVGATFAF